MKKKCKRRDVFKDGSFNAGGARFKVRDGFQGIGIGDTRDVFPNGHLLSGRV
jgi:hypothetical protein